MIWLTKQSSFLCSFLYCLISVQIIEFVTNDYVVYRCCYVSWTNHNVTVVTQFKCVDEQLQDLHVTTDLL